MACCVHIILEFVVMMNAGKHPKWSIQMMEIEELGKLQSV